MTTTYGTEQSFVIYPDQFFSGLVETLQQEADVFNGSSANTVRFLTQTMIGDFEKESFIKSTANLVQHRNPQTVSSIEDTPLSMLDVVSVKSNKRIGPVAETLDAFKKIAVDPMEFSMLLGQQTGVAVAIEYANSALASVRAAIASINGLQYDNTGQTIPTATHTALSQGLSLFGDKASRILAWVMHSTQYFELQRQSIADKVFQVAGATIYEGTVATLGKPAIVVDSPSLIGTGSTASNANKYDILGLVENSVIVVESEERSIVSQLVTGQENLVMRIQGEYAFNTKVKGCTYNLTNGGINPTDAVLGDPANWQFQYQDTKLAPGVRITTL